MIAGWPQAGSCFSQTLRNLEFEETEGFEADLFSQGCVLTLNTWDPSAYGYRFVQIFEPQVLEEVALISGVAPGPLERLDATESRTAERLRLTYQEMADLTPVQAINAASACASVARFVLAGEFAKHLDNRGLVGRDLFELGWLEFLIANRVSDGKATMFAFNRMRRAIDARGIPDARILDMCTQGIVWFLKRRDLAENMFRWCVDRGQSIVARRAVRDPAAVSNWYRGLAMVPAAARNAVLTRTYMNHAREHAEVAVAKA